MLDLDKFFAILSCDVHKLTPHCIPQLVALFLKEVLRSQSIVVSEIAATRFYWSFLSPGTLKTVIYFFITCVVIVGCNVDCCLAFV